MESSVCVISLVTVCKTLLAQSGSYKQKIPRNIRMQYIPTQHPWWVGQCYYPHSIEGELATETLSALPKVTQGTCGGAGTRTQVSG